MVQGVSFASLPALDPTARLTRGGDGYKPANTGSLGSRIVNWVTETFFKGSVRGENVKAYEGARAGWRAANGPEPQGVSAFFDHKIATGATFSADAMRPVTMQSGAVATAVMSAILQGAADNNPAHGRVPVGGGSGAALNEQFIKDAPRQTYLIDGAVLIRDGRDAHGTHHNASSDSGQAAIAQALGGALVERFGEDYVEGISNCVTQVLGVPVIAVAGGSESPLRFPDGRAFQASTLPNIVQTANLTQNADGSVHVAYTAAFKVNPNDPSRVDPSNPLCVLSDQSHGEFSYAFDIVKGAAPGQFDMVNMSPMGYRYDISIRPGFDSLVPG